MDAKIDTCARYSIVGPELRACGEKNERTAPVNYVEGLGGNRLRVEGLWTFTCENVYGQRLVVDALVVAGCGNRAFQKLVFFKKHLGANIRVHKNVLT